MTLIILIYLLILGFIGGSLGGGVISWIANQVLTLHVGKAY